MRFSFLHPLVSPLFVKIGSSRIIALGKDKRQLFDEPALIARSTRDGTVIAFGHEASELQNVGTKEIEVVRFLSRGIIADELLAISFFTWMHEKLTKRYIQKILPLPIVYSYSVGLPHAYKMILEQALRSASFLPVSSYPAVVADASYSLSESHTGKPVLVIRMGATHIQIGIIKGETIVGSTAIPIGGDDIDLKLAQSIRLQESVTVPRSFVAPLKEQYTKALSTQSTFSAVVRGRRIQSGSIESIHLREQHIEPVIRSFFDEVSERIIWELSHTLSWDAQSHRENVTLLTGALCVFPESKSSLAPMMGDQLRTAGRASLASALGLVSLWQ